MLKKLDKLYFLKQPGRPRLKADMQQRQKNDNPKMYNIFS